MTNSNAVPLFEKKRSRNFISRLIEDGVKEERNETRHSTNINGQLYFLRPGVLEQQQTPCILSDLSTGGAFIKSKNHNLAMQQVYLMLKDVPHKFLAVTIAYSQNGYHLRFPKRLSAKVVEMIANGQASQLANG
tara:strand:+ start:1074 stop:1475 length:402 start_codon:yes stop_codon:yes gene_type:complete